jgi:hypothetical protein
MWTGTAIALSILSFMAPTLEGASVVSPPPLTAHLQPDVSMPYEVTTPQARAPRGGSASEQKRYAERDARAQQAKEFRGGDTLIIGATTVTVVLAVILLIILL